MFNNNTTVSLEATSSTTQAHFFRVTFAAILNIIVGVLGSVLCLTAITLCHRAKRRTDVDPFFISICIYALIFSGFFSPLSAYTTVQREDNFLLHEDFRWLCELLAFSCIEILMTHVYTYAAIALHRFFAIVLGHHWPWLRSNQCTILLTLLPWLMSGSVAIWPLFGLGSQYGFGRYFNRCGTVRIYALAYYQFLRSFHFFFSVTVMFICYAAVTATLLVSRRKSAPSGGVVAATGHGRRMRREVVLTKVTLTLTVVFLCLEMPGVLQPLVAKNSAEIYSTIGDSVLIFLEFGCVVNPWFIIFLTPALHSELAKRLRKVIRSETMPTTSISVHRPSGTDMLSRKSEPTGAKANRTEKSG